MVKKKLGFFFYLMALMVESATFGKIYMPTINITQKSTKKVFAELEYEYYIYQNLNFIWELVMVKLFQVFLLSI